MARQTPFVIRLKDRDAEKSEVEGVAVRIDPGSRETGIAITADIAYPLTATPDVIVSRRGLYSLELRHRGSQIRDKMHLRAAYRHRRRSRKTRYRAPRYSNRQRPEGWLPPSLKHRVDTTYSWVRRLQKWAPVTEIHIERTSFDVHALSAGVPLQGIEYQQGTLQGYEVRQYLLEHWRRRCAYCGASGVALQIEHIRPRSRGGSDRLSNLTLACEPCNLAKGSFPVEVFLKGEPRRLARILGQAKAPLRDAAVMNATRWTLWRRLQEFGVPVHSWSGGRTKYNRSRHGLPKTHSLDALAVGDVPDGTVIGGIPTTVLLVSCTGRGTHARTRTDKHGFPRLKLPRTKQFFGYATGDLVTATVPTGKNAGTHVGRVAVRSSGRFNIRGAHGLVQGIHHRHVRLLQRADGYGYARRAEDPQISAPR